MSLLDGWVGPKLLAQNLKPKIRETNLVIIFGDVVLALLFAKVML
jgi:hypothetical protein